MLFLVLACVARLCLGDQVCAEKKALQLGVDYYPEQWPAALLRQDLARIKAMGATMVRVGEFMWSTIEPRHSALTEEPVFDFALLDSIIDAAEEAGLDVMLGTPTATMPSWLARTYGESVLLKAADSADGAAGAIAGFGGRRQYSFNSPTYLAFAKRVTAAVGRRYADRAIVTHFQIDNEFGHESSDLDFSESSLLGFRAWLQRKYNIQELNEAWGTIFWSATYGSFEEIGLPTWTVPGASSTTSNFRSTVSPGMLLDFRRFRRDSITAFSDAMVDELRNASAKGLITTNAPGGTWGKTLDYADIFEKMDLPSYDNYPVWGGSTEAPLASVVAMNLDLVRGWSSKDPEFIITEQLIGAQGHDIIGFTPRPQQAVAWSLAGLAHGATGLLYFRYRPAVFGQEIFCYGVLEHDGSEGRKFREASQVFELAKEHEDLFTHPITTSKVALLYSADAVFSWQGQPQSNAFGFEQEAHRLYHPFWRHGLSGIDVRSLPHLLEEASTLLEKYRVIILPAPLILGGRRSDKETSDETIELLTEFVLLGGSLWCSFRADLLDSKNWIRDDSRLAALAGVAVSEIESLNTGMAVEVSDNTTTARATVFREGLSIVEDDVEAVWRYTDPFFGGLALAAVTRRRFVGGGEVVYVGAGVEPEALVALAEETLRGQKVRHLGSPAEPDLEQLLRVDTNGDEWRVAINHAERTATTTDGIELKPFQVHIAKDTGGKAASL